MAHFKPVCEVDCVFELFFVVAVLFVEFALVNSDAEDSASVFEVVLDVGVDVVEEGAPLVGADTFEDHFLEVTF